jgi:signal transduction histidine kinase
VQVGGPEARARHARHLAGRVAREPFQKRAWAELAYFLASSALALCFAVGIALVGAGGVLLSAVVVGVLVLAGGLRWARSLSRWQRALALYFLGDRIAGPEPLAHRPGFLGWLRATLGDRVAWRAIAYTLAKLPLTIFGAWFALSIWLEALLSLSLPLLGRARTFPRGFGVVGNLFGASASTAGSAPGFFTHVGVFLAGLVLLFIAPWPMRLVVGLDRRLMHALIGPDAATSRVRRLEESRAKTVDAAAETLRRIERDLHDGTQAQLVALAMRLGQAKEKLGRLPAGDTEVAAVRRLVDEAHRGAKEAITDLRDLARGIHPPALDTGLENALATLASRSSVPTELAVSLPSRPSPALEAISYFCAAELLANVAQHAQASRASLSCTRVGPWLRVVVRDDGRGGAALNRAGPSSSGLAGLGDRVGAVDGHLSIASPAGGPTTITVDLPWRA